MKKYNVTFDVFLMEHHFEIEAKNKEEAIEEAKNKSNYRDAELTVFEVEKA